MLVRGDGDDAHAVAASDERGVLRAPQRVHRSVGSEAAQRVEFEVRLPDDRGFGFIIGFGDHSLATEMAELRRHAELAADMLGSLAAAELALAAIHRATDAPFGHTDPLTGLATRRGWEHRLRRDERFCAEFGEEAAVILVELDELKSFNERDGHSAGDEQLRLAGGLVRDLLNGRHFAARVTGDRLGILMVGINHHEVGELERALRATLSGAQVSAAVGVGLREPAHGFEEALVVATAELERNSVAKGVARVDANEAAALLGAIERGEIVAYFQPVVDLRTGDVVAVEALARWVSPEGVREPERFLRPLQEAGLLGALFDRILDDGLAHLAQFRAVVPNLRLAVNVEFDTTGSSLLTSVTDRLARHRLPPSALSIELSERQTFDLPVEVRADLAAVASLGVELMLDDFGTGFASLETLTSLPISGVKLDRKFTSQVVNGDREPVVVKAMIAMTAEAGLSVIAEGIETQRQCDMLVRMGCRLGQGYLFALPQPAESMHAVLSAPLVSLF
ncbi:MAG TPA: hypothetical protein DCR14_19580 [Acidimicrobiaceae bacterium]|nr:hypothetical protein [Acidimicrobiaceae bacterium]